jgi:protein involved in polysaccharide export with SLBB domain
MLKNLFAPLAVCLPCVLSMGFVGSALAQATVGVVTTAAPVVSTQVGPASLAGLAAPQLTQAAAPMVETALAPEVARPTTPASAKASQFQLFVQEATGQLLPTFGASLFDAPSTYAPVTNIAPPANYVLGPGDEIQLQIWGVADVAAALTVGRNGQVVVPKVGAINLAGVRVEQLEPLLKAHVGKVLANFDLSATVSKLRTMQVYVVGQAKRPGTYTLSSLSTLVNALFASGGPNANGSMRAIELKRAGQTVTRLDLYDFINQGDQSKDVGLLPGDVIVVPPVGPQVAVVGALDHAAIYELGPRGNTVSAVLNGSGGVPTLASRQRALLERINPQANPARQVLELTLDATGLQQTLQDGDVLTLLGISPAFGNAVTLQGTVAAPLRYKWHAGMRLLDLIPERDALITADYYRRKNLLVQTVATSRESVSGVAQQIKGNLDAINWDYAVIERLDRKTLTNQLIPFNLGKLVLQRDPAHNLELQPGDVVTILSQNDLRVPVEKQTRLVRVEGEVVAPGVYQVLPGETLPQLVQRIGGLTPQAYVFGTEFTREEVRKQQQKNLDTLVARLESSLQSQANAQVANLSSEQAAQAKAVLEAQRQSQQEQISRLKALRSNGRVALELAPETVGLSALPTVPLEDGDRIVIPAAPSFVAAFGAVNNENVFIHKPGRTVADVLRLAGLTEDAEEDQIFVLRADGTVVSKRDRVGLFGGGFNILVLQPGDTVVVPQKVDRETRWTAILRNTKDITQILANLGLGLAALRSL